MKLYKNIWKPVVLSFIFAAVSPATAFARGEATGPAQEIALAEQAAVYSGDVNTLQAAEDATQLIVVVGNTLDPAKGNLSWFFQWRRSAGCLELQQRRRRAIKKLPVVYIIFLRHLV